jgi:hypothetical protein
MNDGAISPHPRLTEPFERGRLTSISAAPQRRPVVLVLGMHRSGTSLCSHVLSALGVDMADQVAPPGHAAPAADNQRGHWERWEIVEFHDRILALFNRGYFTPFHDFPLPVAWWADPRVADIRREIAAFLEKRMGNGYFGFKDPRTARLMPIWHQLANELGFAPKILFCLRNPAQVARSLHAREGLPVESGEYRWLLYVVDLFRNIRGSEFCTIEYESWFEDPAPNLRKLRDFLDLPAQQPDVDVDLAIWEIIDPELRHDDQRAGEARQPLVRSLYKLARRAGHDLAAREQAQNIAAQFLSFQQLQGAFQRAFEQTAAIADRLPPVEQAAAALRDALNQRDAEVAAAGERASAAEAGLAAALAEIEAQRSRLAEIERERDDRAAALAARLDERNALLAAAQSELEAVRSVLKAELDESETARQVLQASLEQQEALLATARNEVEAVRLAGERRADALTAELHAAEEEARAREIMASTLREREVADRAETAKALDHEIASLKSAAAAAQQVGKAALQALATEVSVTPPPEPLGWLQIIRWPFGFIGRPKETVITRADRARHAGQWEVALGLYRIALDRNPRNPPIWVQYGHALKELGKTEASEAAYRRAISYAPAAADPYLQLGHVLKLQGRSEEAQSAYLRALVIDPSSTDPSRELAAFGWSEMQLSQLRNPDRAITGNPGNVGLLERACPGLVICGGGERANRARSLS